MTLPKPSRQPRWKIFGGETHICNPIGDCCLGRGHIPYIQQFRMPDFLGHLGICIPFINPQFGGFLETLPVPSNTAWTDLDSYIRGEHYQLLSVEKKPLRETTVGFDIFFKVKWFFSETAFEEKEKQSVRRWGRLGLWCLPYSGVDMNGDESDNYFLEIYHVELEKGGFQSSESPRRPHFQVNLPLVLGRCKYLDVTLSRLGGGFNPFELQLIKNGAFPAFHKCFPVLHGFLS